MKSQTTFQRYELPLFFLLAILLSWWTAPFMQGGLFPYGPTLAAVIVISLAAGRQGLHRFWRNCTNFRSGRWYFIGPAIIAAYLLTAFVVNVLMGAMMVTPFPFPSFGTYIMLLLMGGLWEEPGWTGYALPRLQERFAPLAFGTLLAALITGFFRSIWHLPLVLSGTIAWYDAVFFIVAFQIIITWLYFKSNRSVPVVMVFHYASNLLTGSIMLQAFTGSGRETYYILFVAFAFLAALFVLWRTKYKLGSEKP